uniref:RRM domain-containing protein n=1 Tax=Panagrolaimus sp. JU765 TaxID=591449 RepID=A0AC34QDZ2_9BILA
MNPQEGYNQDSLPMNGHANGDGQHRSEKGKNEDRKIFVGGISYDVVDQDLITHFQKFGDIGSANVKFDRATGRSRGFAFVEFSSVEGCQRALQQREQSIKNKNVEVKPAKSHENKKVFIGGIPADLTEDELRNHFSNYGRVEEIEWPTDKVTKQHRNFAFIVFEDESAADAAASLQKHQIRDRECDVKKAVPRSRRMNPFSHNGPQMGGFPGMGGMHHQQQQQWFNPSQWQQMGFPYGGAHGGWADWYNNQMASYYQTGQQTGANNGNPNTTPGNYNGPPSNFKQNRSRQQYSGYDAGQMVNNQH